MKWKKFKTLEISKYVQPAAAAYIEKWLGINDSDEFIKKIFFTLRDIHSVVRNQEPATTTNSNFFLGRRADKVPRFDLVIKDAAAKARAKST
jgi:hypothetical protein